MKTWIRKTGALLLAVVFLVSGCGTTYPPDEAFHQELPAAQQISISEVPPFSGEPYVVIDGNEPAFAEEDLVTDSYESYSELDGLGRCGAAVANIGQDLMPTEKRGAIGQVKPTGWHSVQYDWVDGKSLYNRCHLIGYQLTAENANEKNLITGTRYMNVDGMLPFENMVADYIKETGNHVLYRVTPVFEGSNLVADGVQMEAKSVEDDGEGICFHVFVYNVQPGVTIDYATGESHASDEDEASNESYASDKKKASNENDTSMEKDASDGKPDEVQDYVLNTNSHKFHRPSCSGVKSIKKTNREDYSGTRADLIDQGYEPCKSCKP